MTAASTDGRADGVCEASNSEIFKSFGFSLMFDTLANCPSLVSNLIKPADCKTYKARLSFVGSFGTAIVPPLGISLIEVYLFLPFSVPE